MSQPGRWRVERADPEHIKSFPDTPPTPGYIASNGNLWCMVEWAGSSTQQSIMLLLEEERWAGGAARCPGLDHRRSSLNLILFRVIGVVSLDLAVPRLDLAAPRLGYVLPTTFRSWKAPLSSQLRPIPSNLQRKDQGYFKPFRGDCRK